MKLHVSSATPRSVLGHFCYLRFLHFYGPMDLYTDTDLNGKYTSLSFTAIL